MNATIRSSIIAALLCLGGIALGADTINWNGTSGKWSSKDIWDGGVVPGPDEIAGFPNGTSGTVEIDGDYQVYAVYVKQNSSNSQEYPVTFKGAGTLVATNTTFIVNTARRFILNGPSIKAAQISVVKAVDVKSGTLGCSKLQCYEGSKTTVTGGMLSAGELKVNSGVCVLAATNATVRLGTITGTPLFEMSGGSFAVTNGGLTVASGVSEAHFDVDSFALAGNLSASDADTRIVFDRAVTIGAYADWGVDSANISSVTFAKSPVFATTDAADGEAGHTITISKFELASEYDSISVAGAGTAHLQPAADMRFDTIDVGAGATLQLSRNSFVTMRARHVKMAAGSAIAYRPERILLDIDSSDIAATASASIDVSSTSDDRLLVWSDLSGGAMPVFSCTGNASYSIRIAGPFAYVTKGAAVSYAKPTCWTGGGDDFLWSTAANWNGTVADGAVAYFNGDNKTVITNDISRGIVRMIFSNNGAYSFFGEPLSLSSTVTNENNAPLNNTGKLPVAVYNTLMKGSAKATGLSFMSNYKSFIALMGEVALTNFIFRFNGDMRVGGNVNCASVVFDEKKGGLEPCCTILSNGTVVVTSQAFVSERGAGYDVRPGGLLDVRGGTWDWSIPVTNRIDGTLKLGAAIGNTAATYFSGRGTIELSGTATTEGTTFRTTEDFGGTIILPDDVVATKSSSGGATVYDLRRRKGMVVVVK